MTMDNNPHLTENFTESQSTTLYVPPPKTGASVVSVRISIEMMEVLNALMYVRDREDNLFFNPVLYKSLSDVIRAVIYQGYAAVVKIVDEEGVSADSRALAAIQRSASEAHILDLLDTTVLKTSESLSRYIAAGALDEARALWNRQMEHTLTMKGHWRKTMLTMLEKFRPACERPKVAHVHAIKKKGGLKLRTKAAAAVEAEVDPDLLEDLEAGA